jgi:carbon-monoxide dehydrogenase catalytic subunit
MQLTTFFPSVGLLLEIFFEDLLLSPSPEAILKALGGSLDPLITAIKSGDIKGIVALVSCTTLKNGPHGYNTVTVAKKLIKRDILILSMGCGNAALQVAGLASLRAIELAGEGLKKVCKALGIPPVLSSGTCPMLVELLIW